MLANADAILKLSLAVYVLMMGSVLTIWLFRDY